MYGTMPDQAIRVRPRNHPAILVPKEVSELVLIDTPRLEGGVFSARSITVMRLRTPAADAITEAPTPSSGPEADPVIPSFSRLDIVAAKCRNRGVGVTANNHRGEWATCWDGSGSYTI
jgi:hypothetical protein